MNSRTWLKKRTSNELFEIERLLNYPMTGGPDVADHLLNVRNEIRCRRISQINFMNGLDSSDEDITTTPLQS